MTTPTPHPLDHGRACLLITGPPGAGKSTVASLIAAALTRAALLRGDMVGRLVTSGYVWPLGDPADEAARQVQLCNHNLTRLASNFADTQFTPVIDWIVPDRDQLDFYREALRPHPLLLVVLTPSPQVCRSRDAARAPEEQFSFDGYDELLASMRDGFGQRGWWLDNSDLTAEATAILIGQHALHRALVPDN